MPSPTEIATAQLPSLIGLSNCPLLINVCIDANVSESPYLIIPGAKRYPAQNIAALPSQLTHSQVVIICRKGKK
jgi:hypothetical protein